MRIKKIFIDEIPLELGPEDLRLIIVLENDQYVSFPIFLSQDVEFFTDRPLLLKKRARPVIKLADMMRVKNLAVMILAAWKGMCLFKNRHCLNNHCF